MKVTEPDLCKGENHVLKKPETQKKNCKIQGQCSLGPAQLLEQLQLKKVHDHNIYFYISRYLCYLLKVLRNSSTELSYYQVWRKCSL